MNRLRLLALLALSWASQVSAQDWGEIAQISTTLGVQADRLCLGEGSRGDIGCPTYAPYVNPTSGNVGIGTTSPQSALQVNGALRVSADASQTSIWLPNSGALRTNTAGSNFYFDLGNVTFRDGTGTSSNAKVVVYGKVLAGEGVVGVTTTPSASLHVRGSVRLATETSSTLNTCDADRAGAIRYSGSNFQVCYGTGGWANLTDTSSTVATADRITSGTAAVIANGNSNSISITESGITTGYYYNGIWVAGGVSTTGSVSATNGYFGNRIGIGAIDPSYSIHIASGDIRTERASGKIGFYSLGNPRAAISSNQANDLVFEYNAGTEGMRLTSGKVGIGTTAPSATLHVSGSVLATSWTYLNANPDVRVTPTAPLEVSGTVSATNFVGNGSGLTNISASAVSMALNDLTDAATSSTTRNMFIGHEGGSVGATDQYNVATGIEALDALADSDADYNVAYGWRSLSANVTGDSNNAIGHQSLLGNTSGSNNIAVGTNSVINNITGSNNVGIGFVALSNQQNSSGQTAIGSEAMRYISGTAADAAINSTAVGYQALRGSSTPTDNTGDYNTGLGASTLTNITTGSQNTATGYGALQNNTIGSYNTANGVNALGMTTTGGYNTAIGRNAMLYNVTGANNTALGYGTLTHQQTSAGQTAVGFEAMYYVSGTNANPAQNNTAVGYQSMRGSSTPTDNTGDYNTAVGQSTLYANTSGGYNSAVGFGSMNANLTGTFNTGLGVNTIYSQQNSSGQTAIGYEAMRYVSGTTADAALYNTALGYWALRGSSTATDNTGDGNTALGTNALRYNSSGSTNTAVGHMALSSLTTGGNNTVLGSWTGPTLTTGSANILIGYGADTPANNTSDFLNIGSAISGTYTTGGVINFLAGIKSAGVVTATYFEGDGSRLTNVTAASTDRITSETSAVIANGSANGGYISLTAGVGGTEWGYLGSSATYLPRLNVAAISVTTNNASFTTLYASGNVGIGVSNPSQRLTLFDSSNATISFRSGTGTPGSTREARIAAISTGGGGNGHSLAFSTNDTGGAPIEYMRLTPDGKLGIATSVPSTSVHVSGSLMVNNGTAAGLSAPHLYVSGTSGRVGIGTGSPATSLDVYGVTAHTENVVNTLGSMIVRGNDITPALTTKGILDIEQSGSNAAQGAGATLTFSNNNWQFGTSYSRVGGAIKVGLDSAVNQDPTSHMAFSTTGFGSVLNEVVRITSGANVGISTTAPSTTLHVSGTIRIANGGETCDANRAGAIRWHEGAGQFQVCYGSGGWALLSSAATSGTTTTPDRIVSGTTEMVASTGFVSVTFGVTTTARFAPTGGYHIFARDIATGSSQWITPNADLVARFMKSGKALVAIQSADNAGISGIEFSGAGQRGRIYGAGDYNIYISPNDQYGATNIIMANQTAANSLRVGIGGLSTSTPVATLDVSGSVKVAGTGSETCGPTTRGSIRQNPTTLKLEVCRY